MTYVLNVPLRSEFVGSIDFKALQSIERISRARALTEFNVVKDVPHVCDDCAVLWYDHGFVYDLFRISVRYC